MRFQSILFVIVFLSVALAVSAHAEVSGIDAAKRGQELFSDGKYDESLASFMVAYNSNTLHPEHVSSVCMTIGRIYLAKGDKSNAAIWFDNGIKNGDKAMGYANRSMFYITQKRYPEAYSDAQLSLTFDNNKTALLTLSIYYKYLGDEVKAAHYQQLARRASPE